MWKNFFINFRMNHVQLCVNTSSNVPTLNLSFSISTSLFLIKKKCNNIFLLYQPHSFYTYHTEKEKKMFYLLLVVVVVAITNRNNNCDALFLTLVLLLLLLLVLIHTTILHFTFIITIIK